VAQAEGQTGRTFAEGAWWSIRSVGPPLVADASARVVGLDGLVLLVDPRGLDPGGHDTGGHDTSAGATAPASDVTANPEAKDTS
jgi:hypothetical protein